MRGLGNHLLRLWTVFLRLNILSVSGVPPDSLLCFHIMPSIEMISDFIERMLVF